MRKSSVIIRSVVWSGILFVVFLGSAVQAAMIEMTLDQLTEESISIIRGTVLSKESWWVEDSSFIFTTVMVRVDESIKGTASVSSTISILVPGGEVGEVGLGVEHAARFETSEEVVVFLKVVDESCYGITGWEQGKFTVEEGNIRENGSSVADFTERIKETLK